MGAKIFLFDHFMLDDDGDIEFIEEYGIGDTSQVFSVNSHTAPHFTSDEEILSACYIDNMLYDEDTDNWERFKELEKAI
jgi:hypothetical protein